MESGTRVVIIILNFNTPKMVKNAVETIRRNCGCSDYRIIVVDNGSDESNYRELCRLLPGLHVSSGSKDCVQEVRESSTVPIIVRLEKNEGFARGNNAGIRFAMNYLSPEYVLLMNSDVYMHQSHTVAKLVQTMDSSSNDAVAIMPLVWNKNSNPNDPRQQIQIRRIEEYWDTLVVNSPILKRVFKRKFKKYVYADEMPFVEITKAYVLSGAFMLLKAEFLKRIGFLDENTFLFHEEIILGRQMQELKVFGLLDPTVAVTHIQGASTKERRRRFSPFVFAHKTKSQLYYIKRYCGASEFQILFFRLVRGIEAVLLCVLLERKPGLVTEYFSTLGKK